VGPAGSGARDGVHVTRVNPLDSTLVLAVNEELVSNIISIRAVSQVRARVTCLTALPHFFTTTAAATAAENVWVARTRLPSLEFRS